MIIDSKEKKIFKIRRQIRSILNKNLCLHSDNSDKNISGKFITFEITDIDGLIKLKDLYKSYRLWLRKLNLILNGDKDIQYFKYLAVPDLDNKGKVYLYIIFFNLELYDSKGEEFNKLLDTLNYYFIESLCNVTKSVIESKDVEISFCLINENNKETISNLVVYLTKNMIEHLFNKSCSIHIEGRAKAYLNSKLLNK